MTKTAPLPKLRVLILDDDANYREYYAKWASAIGFSPIATGNLSDAQKIIANQEIDIAIIDLFLDRFSNKAKGLLLFEDISELHEKNGFGPFIIAVSGDTAASTLDMEMISDYQSLGIVTAFLSKETLDKGKMQNAVMAAAEKIRVLNNSSNLDGHQSLRVFLYASSSDKDSVQGLRGRLNLENDIDLWYEEMLLPGQNSGFEIENALRSSDVFLFCCSANSVMEEGYIQRVLKSALDIAREKPEGAIFIIPIKLEECQIPPSLKHLQPVNLYEKGGYSKLLRSLGPRIKK